jgi:hypothetical protein
LPLRESRRFSGGHDDADEGTMSWTSQLFQCRAPKMDASQITL